jgi:hypothetical protein
MENGFLEPFEEFVVKRTGTHPLWARSLALNALSSAIGDKVVIYTMKGPLQLNLFFLNLGASGLAKKSIPLINYFYPVLIHLGSLLNVKLIIPSGTSEGMQEYLNSTEVKEHDKVIHVSRYGTIMQDEFGRFAKDVRNKKYMSGMLEFLSEIYNGRIKERYTKASKYESSVDVCIGLISDSTPDILTILQREFFTQGLGNRILYVYSGEGKLAEPNDPEKYFSPLFDDDRKKRIESFASQLKAYAENCTHIEGTYTYNRCIISSPESNILLVDYEFSKNVEAQRMYREDPLNLQYSYIVRLPEFAFKLAALHAIDREGSRPWKNPEDNAINLTLEDAQWAIKTVEEYFLHYEKLLVLWETLERAERVRVRRQDPEEIKALISATGFSGITITELRHKAYSRGFKPERFMECVNILLQSGEVLQKTEGEEGKPGPKATIFFVLEPKNLWLKEGTTNGTQT